MRAGTCLWLAFGVAVVGCSGCPVRQGESEDLQNLRSASSNSGTPAPEVQDASRQEAEATPVRGSQSTLAQGQSDIRTTKLTPVSKNGHVAEEQRERPHCMERVRTVRVTEELAEHFRKTVQALGPANRIVKGAKGPETLDEAGAFLFRNMSMACPPARCASWEGWFLFSGGTTATEVTDFSTGLAIKKGSTTIYSW